MKSRFIASPTMRETFHCYESSLGSKWLCVPVFREGECTERLWARITPSWISSGRISVLQGAIFLVSPLKPRAQFQPWVPQQSYSPRDPTGREEQLNSCKRWLLAHLFQKGIFTVLCFFSPSGHFFLVCFGPQYIYNFHQMLKGKYNFTREKQSRHFLRKQRKDML